jgi:hypothetical protein
VKIEQLILDKYPSPDDKNQALGKKKLAMLLPGVEPRVQDSKS